MKIVDISFYAHEKGIGMAEALERHKESFGYIPYLKDRADIMVVKHFADGGQYLERDGVPYYGFYARNKFFHMPLQSIRHIRAYRPDVVIVQGLIYPFQVQLLKLCLGRHTRFIVQHHGERPFISIPKKYYQKLSKNCANRYLFTSLGNALPYIESHIIEDVKKCAEVMEASTYIRPVDKEAAKAKLGMSETFNLLWVGRLNKDKDPMTVLKGLEIFLQKGGQAKLYMVYQTEELLEEMKRYITNSDWLRDTVVLVGKVDKEELAYWYSATDVFVSGSHREGSGYALIESMACGCVPVVTDIPPFRTITAGCKYGYLFGKGSAEAFAAALAQAGTNSKQLSPAIIKQHFEDKLTFRAIADDIYRICHELTGKY